MSIYEKIENKGREESQKIREEAQREAASLERKVILEAEREVLAITRSAESAKQTAISQKRALAELEKRQANSELKNGVISEIFSAVRTHFINLEGTALLDFVSRQIKREKIAGDEVMRVAQSEYDKYLAALSTHRTGKMVELDLLNERLGGGFRLRLEDVPSGDSDGFIILGDTFDLNFCIDPLLEKIRKSEEKRLSAQLFGEK